MKKLIIISLAVLALCACGKTRKTGTNEAAGRQFDAWVYVQKQKATGYLWKQTALGSYILEETVGTGEPVGELTDSTYFRVEYTVRSADGTIASTTSRKLAQQLGTYDETCYYGPVTMYAGGLYAGVEEAVCGMRQGGKLKIVVPPWLVTYDRYDTADDYFDKVSNSDAVTCIYDIELVECFEGIKQWGADSLGRYLTAHFPSVYGTDPVKAVADSSGTFGFYYVRTKEPKEVKEMTDTTVYINYTGRLLNGQVFDTTIRDTAIKYGLNRDKTYEPVSISLGDTWSDVKMGSESTKVISGFARTLARMSGPFEAGSGIFIESLGYGYSGSGSSIPAYAPLRFDVELVEQP